MESVSLKSANLSVLDLDIKGLTMAKNNKNLAIQGQMTYLPIKSQTIDLVVCVEVLTLVQEDEKVANEIVRILKPGGKLIASTSIKGFKLPFDPHQVTPTWGQTHHVYTPSDFCGLFKNAGLEILTDGYFYNFISRLFYSILFLCGISRARKLRFQLWNWIAGLERFCKWGGKAYYLAAEKIA